MKYYKLTRSFLLLTALIPLISCGGGGGGGGDKDLFSLWTEVGDDLTIDFTGESLGVPFQLVFVSTDDSQCECSFTLSGTQTSGTFTIEACTHIPGTGPGDPGCNGLNDTGTYSKTSTTLTATDSSGESTTFQ